MNPLKIEIAVGRIIGPDDEIPCNILSGEELDYASRLSGRRRREWLTWRSILHANAERWDIPAEQLAVEYEAGGRPVFKGIRGCLSVTHCRDYAAVAYTAEGRCGIDVEQLDRRFDRVTSKYISADEAALPEVAHPLFKAAVWCAKEALYKCLGRDGVDFLRDMHVTATDLDGGTLTAEAFGCVFVLEMRRLCGAVMVYTAVNGPSCPDLNSGR